MGAFESLLHGLGLALHPDILIWALWGCLLGNLVGVLPGIGSAGAIALLLPLTFALPPGPAIVMLSAIFYGSNYGATISAVLLNIPGEANTAVTTLDGVPMARQGRAGAALCIAAIASFIGGTAATFGLALGAPYLAELGLLMGPAERFGLMVFALALVSGLLGRAVVKGLIMVFFGLLIGTVGIDPTLGMPRFTFGRPELLDGINFVAIVLGVFGVSEVLINSEKQVRGLIAKVGSILPTRDDLRRSVAPVLRGTGIGFLVGMVPGLNGAVAAFLSYSTETTVAREPERFGKGAVEGVAGPEASNNAFANANFIPLFALGIPGTASLAILMGGMMMYGITPGPFLFRDDPDLVWMVIASMIVGNVILLVLNIPLVSIWIQILRIPYSLLAPMILTLALVGSFAVAGPVGIVTTVAFGLLGYAFKKLSLPLAPFILTLIVGPLMESNLRRALQISQGDPMIILSSPIAAGFLGAALVILIFTIARTFIRIGHTRHAEEGA